MPLVEAISRIQRSDLMLTVLSLTIRGRSADDR